jgi:mannose-6-phosphate isomerase-like protein (cupin superfamily)
MAEPDRKKIAADWGSRGFGCDLWTDPPGQKWEDFRHATDELVTVLEGSMEFKVAGVILHPKIGEELLIPAAAIHSARNIGKTTARPHPNTTEQDQQCFVRLCHPRSLTAQCFSASGS